MKKKLSKPCQKKRIKTLSFAFLFIISSFFIREKSMLLGTNVTSQAQRPNFRPHLRHDPMILWQLRVDHSKLEYCWKIIRVLLFNPWTMFSPRFRLLFLSTPHSSHFKYLASIPPVNSDDCSGEGPRRPRALSLPL